MIPLSCTQGSIARAPDKTGPEVLFASCGSNEQGQLGTGDNVSSSCFRTTDWSSLPSENGNTKAAVDESTVIGTTIAIQTQQPFRINNLSALSCGESHTVCCWNDSAIYAWGNNDFGQLGLQKTATTNYALVPTRIPVPNLYDGTERESDNSISNSTIPLHVASSVVVRTVSCGSFHTLVVTSTGCLLTCGKNSDGCLGLGTLEEYRSELTRVTVFVTENSDETQSPIIVGAAAGYAHSLALTQHGSVFSFGRGAEGQLGDGKFGSSASSSYSTDLSSLVHVGGSSTMLEEDSSDTETAKSFLVGNITTASSINDENTIASGKEQIDEYLASNDDDGGFPHRSLVPVIVSGLLANKPVAIIACSKGGHGCFAVTASDGYGWRWGLLDNNRAASKKSMIKCVVPTPTPLPPPLGTSAEEAADVIISGPFDSAPVENKSNTLPSPEDAKRSYNVSLRKTDNRIVSISAGAHHLICVTRSGEAWAMGGPGPFLGLGPGCQVEWLHAPGRVLLPGDILINGVACGETHTLLSTACGKVFACGEPSTCLGVVDSSWKNASESGAVVNVPKEVLLTNSSALAVDSEPKQNKNDTKKCRNKSSSRKTVKACFIGEYSYGRDSVSSFLLKECEDDAAAKTMCFMEDQSVLESFADDDDYWEEDVLGYELEMDFFQASAPYGGGSARADIMSSTSLASFRRLTCETKRHICNSTLAVGGAIISGGQKIGGIVSAVASGLQVSSGSTTGDQTKTDTSKPQQRSKVNDASMRGLAPAKLCRSESQQDSFDGLTGNSRRIIHMSAGRNLSIIHMADKPDS